MSFIDEMMKSVGGEVTKEIASKMNIDKGIAEKLLPQIAPLILGGLKRQKDEQGGAERVDHILNKYGSSSVLDNISGLFSQKAKEKNPDPQLGGLLGKSGLDAVSLISKQFNLKGDQVSKLIPMLAPIVLGSLTKKRDAEGAGSSGIASLLDQDGDGSILDDVAGFLMKGSGSSKGGSGLLGGLLSGLLKKRR